MVQGRISDGPCLLRQVHVPDKVTRQFSFMLSHHHKTIFIHIPKCAGQSVETAFLFDLGLTWETRAPLLLRYNDKPQLGPPRLAHLVARDYVRCRYVTEEMFNGYFRFTVVRNPWSRAVSLYRHLDFNMPFREFVTQWLAEQIATGEVADRYWFVRPQREFIIDKDKQLVDEVIRFESLHEDFKRIVAATGLKTALPHVNRRSSEGGVLREGNQSSLGSLRRLGKLIIPNRRDDHDDWKKFYRDETAETIAKLYKADVSEFNYSFDS